MSASPPSRYRSRLFNVVNHYSRRLIDRGERAIQHLKVAAVWGTQILLYPVYLVVQTSLTAKRRLSTQAKAGWTRFKVLIQSQPPTQLPAVDTPIRQVLQQVETLPLPEPCQWQGLQPVNPENSQTKRGHITQNLKLNGSPIFAGERLGERSSLAIFKQLGIRFARNIPANWISWVSFLNPTDKVDLHPINIDPYQISDLSSADQAHLTSSRIQIQGVATLLSTRTLVLVSVTNEILDILTPEQQQTLAARISWEVATLYRQWRLSQTVKVSGGQYSLSRWAKPPLFLPLRVFWQLMAYVQTSPVAIALNLFGESSLVAVGDSEDPIQAITFHSEIPQTLTPAWLERLTLGETLAAIDDRIAQWESHPKQTSTHLAIALRQRGQTLLQTVKPSFITPGQPSNPSQTSASHPFWLVGLIYAAIDYFFGQDHSHHSHPPEITSVNWTENRTQQFPNPTPSVTLPGADFTYTTEPDPWLTWDDLFASSDLTFTTTSAVPNFIELKGKVQHNLPQLYPGSTVKKKVVWKNTINAILRSLGFPQPTGTLTVTDGEQSNVQPQSDQGVPRMPVNPIRWFSALNRTVNLAETANSLTQSQQQIVHSTYPIPLPYSGITALANHSENGTVVKVFPGTLSKQSSTRSHNSLLFDSSSPLSVPTAFSSPSEQAISYSHNSDLELAPDWIEAEAMSTGYVKHPLEQILEWLDIGMFWLEEVTIKAWRWMRRLMIQKKR